MLINFLFWSQMLTILFFFSVTIPGYQGNLQAAVSHSASLDAWKRFGVELVLTFIVVLSYLVSTDSYKKHMGSAALSVGAAYCACSFVSVIFFFNLLIFICNKMALSNFEFKMKKKVKK